MLNLAVIRSVSYYLDEVASDPTAYYLGRGEAPGRWWGRLAGQFTLSGAVEPAALPLLLEGQHPGDGASLLRARAAGTAGPAPSESDAGATMDATVAAQALGVSPRTVRRWAAEGERLWRVAQDADASRVLRTPGEVRDRLAAVLGPEAARAVAGCLLVPPAPGRRRRWDLPASEVTRLRDERRVPATRLGYDVVFRAAKGWSVLWAVGPPDVRDALAGIHREAVADALIYLESTSAVTRVTVPWRGRPVRIRARGEGLVVACFDHRESRASDPLLHTHCLVANLTRLPGGRFGALEASALFRQQRAADAVYQATFRHLAERRLGIVSVPGPSPFPEPDGVPAAVIEHFSKRTEEIADEVERHGSASAAARQLAALATRRAKDVAARDEDLHSRWRREAAELGFGEPDAVACLRCSTGRGLTAGEIDAVLTRLAGPDGLTVTAATFTRADVIQALGGEFGAAMPGADLVATANRFLTSDAVVQVREHRPGRPRGRILEDGRVVDDVTAARFSVPDLVAIEERLIAAAGERSRVVLDAATVTAALSGASDLSGQHVAMVTSVCGSDRLLRPVVGLPGTGKTTATRGLAGVLRSAGLPVVGCAVTATAAGELARGSGLAVCDTLARTLADLDAPGAALAPGTVVIADEASMLGHRQLDRLVAHVRRAHGALVLIGDPHQHTAVGPGSFFAWLTGQRPDIPMLTTNLRQRDILGDDGEVVVSLAAERDASGLFRDGLIAESLHARDGAGLVTRAATPAELHERIIADWWSEWRHTGDPMVASSNDTRIRLNAAARRLLAGHGLLHGPALVTGSREFQAGDTVVARRNDRRLRSPSDPSWCLRNGALGRVVAVDLVSRRLTVDFTGAAGATHRLELPGGYVADHLEHGYAVTDYGVQGRHLPATGSIRQGADGDA